MVSRSLYLLYRFHASTTYREHVVRPACAIGIRLKSTVNGCEDDRSEAICIANSCLRGPFFYSYSNNKSSKLEIFRSSDCTKHTYLLLLSGNYIHSRRIFAVAIGVAVMFRIVQSITSPRASYVVCASESVRRLPKIAAQAGRKRAGRLSSRERRMEIRAG